MRALSGAVAVLALALAVPLAESAAKKGEAQLVSKQSSVNGGFAGNGESRAPAISANGRIVAFATLATNLGGPFNPVQNIYAYNRKTKRVTLISRRSKAQGGEGADAGSYGPAVSANGRFIAFDTNAQNLGNGAGSNLDKVYVYDRKRKRVQLVSRRSKKARGAPADGNANSASISADGRFVSFRSPATLGLGTHPASGSNVWVYDRKRKRVELVSRRSKSANGKGHNGSVITPGEISANGRFVTFTSDATNLSAAAKEGIDNCYVYDRKRKRVELVSRRSGKNGKGANGDCFNPRISANGRFVAINTGARNLGDDNTPNKWKIYVYDRKRKRIELVTRRSANGPAADANAEIGDISADGRWVGFTTDADNLGGPIDTNYRQSYAYDRKRGKVRLLSRVSKSAGGGAANESSFGPIPSRDGRFWAFPTNATNLGDGVVMATSQVYVFDLLGP